MTFAEWKNALRKHVEKTYHYHLGDKADHCYETYYDKGIGVLEAAKLIMNNEE